MKKVLIQFGISEKRLSGIFEAMKTLGLNYDFFSYYVEDRILDDFPEDFLENDWVAFSSIPAVLYSAKKDPQYYKSEDKFNLWNEHFIKSYFNDDINNLEQEVIFEKIKNKEIPYLPMLNEKSQFLTMQDLNGRIFDEPVFMKPNSTMKQFIGGVTLPGEKFEDFLVRKSYCGKEVGVMLSESHNIHSEYRFFVYKGKVLTGSSYFLNRELNKTLEIPSSVYSEAHRLASLYQPGIAFTLDLGLLDNGDIKIVEYNKFTASGPYNCNMLDVLKVMCFDE